MRRRGGWGLGLALVAAGAVALARGRLRRYEIAEDSMQPTLAPGDYVLAIRSDAVPARGDIVIFSDEAEPGFELVKRVVGLPGERVAIARNQVHIDDAPLAEPWADGPTRPDGTWELGTDEIFLLGDQRSRSTGDSRSVGPVGADRVRWRVAVRYWPPQRFGGLSGS